MRGRGGAAIAVVMENCIGSLESSTKAEVQEAPAQHLSSAIVLPIR